MSCSLRLGNETMLTFPHQDITRTTVRCLMLLPRKRYNMDTFSPLVRGGFLSSAAGSCVPLPLASRPNTSLASSPRPWTSSQRGDSGTTLWEGLGQMHALHSSELYWKWVSLVIGLGGLCQHNIMSIINPSSRKQYAGIIELAT